jgi:flagellar motor switch protein FliN/FliY
LAHEVLTQSEIDALLRQGAGSGRSQLSKDDFDALGEVGNIAMGTAATALSTLLGARVQITVPHVTLTTRAAIRAEFPIPFVTVEVGYSGGLSGLNLLIIKVDDAKIIASLMMGMNGVVDQAAPISELEVSAVAEAMNQMMGSAATSMSTMFQRPIGITPPKVDLLDLQNEDIDGGFASEDEVIKIGFQMNVEGFIDSGIMLLLTVPFAMDMLSALRGETSAAPAPAAPASRQSAGAPEPQAGSRPSAPPAAAPKVVAQPHVFEPLESTFGGEARPDNLDLILDVPLELTVELGRTKKPIRDVLALGSGSIIELERLAGEPVDIYVNGQLVAHGEVVVIDENFAVRVTDIVSVQQRLLHLRS